MPRKIVRKTSTTTPAPQFTTEKPYYVAPTIQATHRIEPSTDRVLTFTDETQIAVFMVVETLVWPNRYTVSVTGPKITKTGKMHGSHRSGEGFTDAKSKDLDMRPISDLPDWIRKVLVGKKVLKADIQDRLEKTLKK